MNAKKITDYLLKYEDLWWILDKFEEYCPLPCMDISMDLINEKDFFGFEFDGDKSVYMLFFLGSSTNFPAICFPHDVEVKLDECPIYFLDSECNTCCNYNLNFKGYILKLLQFYLKYKKGEPIYDNKGEIIELDEDTINNIKEAEFEELTIEYIENAIKDLDVFSDKLIDYEYKLVLSEGNY